MLTLHADCALAARAMSAGASAFVVKTSLDDDLLAAVHAALRGGQFVTECVAER